MKRDLPSYLNATAVAKLLGISPKTVAAWSRNDPTMPVTRVGRTLRFDEAALYRWLASKTSRTRVPLFPSTGSIETRARALVDAAQALANDHRRMSRKTS